MKIHRIGDMMVRLKEPIEIEDGTTYKRLTIRTNHNGVRVRDTEIGAKIGTKKQFTVTAGDFILSKIDARQGAFGIVPPEGDGAIITGNFWTYRVNTDLVDTEWFLQFTATDAFVDLCKRSSVGNTHRKYLSEPVFLNHEVPIPQLAVQRLVVKNCEIGKESVALQSAEIETQQSLLTKLKQAILQEAIQGDLTADWRAEHADAPDVEPARDLLARIQTEKARLIAEKKIRKEKPLPEITEDEIPFDIPDGWEWCRFGSLAMDVSYGTSQKCELVVPNGIPVLRMGNITLSGEILYSNFKYLAPTSKDLPKLFLKRGDLVFNRTNSLELVGKSAIFDHEGEFTLASYLIRARFPSDFDANVVAFFLNSKVCRTEYIEPGVIQQNGQANFNGSKLKNIPIPLPPLAEQAVIVERVEALMETCAALEAEIEHSRSHAENLLQAVLKEAFAPAAG